MNAPWKGELSVHLPPSHADGPANVITVTAFLCDETGHGIAATEYVGRAEDLAHRANAYPKLVEALERAHELVRLLTIRQIMDGGYEAIEAAGLHPYAVNEGRADPDDTLGYVWWIAEALASTREEG